MSFSPFPFFELGLLRVNHTLWPSPVNDCRALVKGGLDALVELLYIAQAAVFAPLSGVEVEKGVLIPVVFTLDYFGFPSRRGKDHPVIPGNSGKLCFVGVDFERGDLERIYVFEQTCGIGITFQLAVGSTVFCVQIAVCFEPFCRLLCRALAGSELPSSCRMSSTGGLVYCTTLEYHSEAESVSPSLK